MSEKSGGDVFLRGVWRENPMLVQILGLCPTLAVTNTVENAVAMALATAFVLVGSSGLVSLVRKVIPDQVRISAYILIIATFVTVVDMLMAAVAPSASRALGPFVPLIVVNCMILGRAEAFASRHALLPSVLDAAGTAAGFTVALLLMGSFRELLGSGSFLGLHVLPQSWEPWVIMILPPGGFLTLGAILMGLSWWWGRGERADEAARPRRWPHGVREPEERAA